MRVTSKTIKQHFFWAAATIAIVGFAGPALAMPFAKRLLFTVVLENAKPPTGWHDFCRQNPTDCQTDPYAAREVTLTDEAFDELSSINRLVNTSIKPKTDRKHWGVADKWSYPDDGYGDCEDYALLKRKLLIETGWSPSALLVAVVWDKNAGHAVLLARTDKGEYVLDNQTSKIMLWSSTKYKFVKRQSPRDLNEWIYVDGDPRKPNLELAAWEKGMPEEKPVLMAASEAVAAEAAPENRQIAAARSEQAESAIDQPMKVPQP